MERKLASIRKISQIIPIENADKIELAKIDGWQVVVRKDEFKAGELACFLEIDSIPPDIPAFQFLWQKDDSNIRPNNFRLRSKKMRGCLSQGLLIPLATLGIMENEEGLDLTEQLNITKWDPPLPKEARGKIEGHFPGFIPKTDEERIQNCLPILQELKDKPYYISLKYDGTSATYYIDPESNQLNCCSRNFKIKEGDNIYWNIARKYNLETVLKENPFITIQGEIVGPGIQKNRLNLKETEMFIFNLFDIKSDEYLSLLGIENFTKQYNLNFVKLIAAGSKFNETFETLLTLARGKYPNTNNDFEGIVIRPIENMYSETLAGRLSFKTINNEFLLKEKD